jgi:hypothetical protein
MNSKPFTGSVTAMKNTPWLSSEDLMGKDEPTLIIDGVFVHEDVVLDGGRKESRLYSIAFQKTKKQMILNATNRKVLSGNYGADVRNWIGKPVTLYVESGVKKPNGKRGETTTGLRFKVIGGKTAAQLDANIEQPTTLDETETPQIEEQAQ